LRRVVYLVEVPYFEHCFAIMERVRKETVPGWECIVLTPEDGAIRQDQSLEQLKVVVPNCVTDVNGATTYGS